MDKEIDELEYRIRLKLGQKEFNYDKYNRTRYNSEHKGIKFDMSFRTYTTLAEDDIMGRFREELHGVDENKNFYLIMFHKGGCRVDLIEQPSDFESKLNTTNVMEYSSGYGTVEIITKIFEHSGRANKYSREKKSALSYIRDEKIDNVLRRQKNNNLLNDNTTIL